MNFPKDICEDCYKKGTCPNYGNPQSHIIHGKIDLIKSSGNINEFKKVLYRELHKRGIFKGPIEIYQQLSEIAENTVARKKAQEILNKAEELLKKTTGKKMNIEWRP